MYQKHNFNQSIFQKLLPSPYHISKFLTTLITDAILSFPQNYTLNFTQFLHSCSGSICEVLTIQKTMSVTCVIVNLCILFLLSAFLAVLLYPAALGSNFYLSFIFSIQHNRAESLHVKEASQAVTERTEHEIFFTKLIIL